MKNTHKIPNFFIVGAPRCGTTAMYEYLRQHPDVFMPRLKEPHYFGRDLVRTPKSFHYKQDEQRYLMLFNSVRDEARIGEASTLYLKSRLAASEIKLFAPSAKIIVMLRNPIEMLTSLHRYTIYHGAEDIEEFAAALDAEPDRKEGQRVPKGCGLVDNLMYRELARYKEQIDRYFQEFGRENVHVIVNEDLRTSTEEVYAETLRFLEVDPAFRPNFSVTNENRRIRNRVLRSIWANRPPVLHRFLFERMPPSLSRGLVTMLKYVGSRPETRQSLAPQLKLTLQNEFREDIQGLSDLLGRDLTHWCRE